MKVLRRKTSDWQILQMKREEFRLFSVTSSKMSSILFFFFFEIKSKSWNSSIKIPYRNAFNIFIASKPRPIECIFAIPTDPLTSTAENFPTSSFQVYSNYSPRVVSIRPIKIKTMEQSIYSTVPTGCRSPNPTVNWKTFWIETLNIRIFVSYQWN